ncbi:MAG TPA: two-component sensor histidine kinase, partial [Thiolinea sp.]|nr:two-component sensor histidine kinase [Thiolinea sp.]
MIRRLLNTTVFRLSLVYALLFSLVAGAAMASIYWVAAGQIREQTDARLTLQSDLLINLARTSGSIQSLRDAIQARNEEHDERAEPHFYVYALTTNTKLPFSKKLEAEYMAENGRRLFGTLMFSDVLDIVDLDVEVKRDAYARVIITRLQGGAQLLVAADMSEQNTLLRKLYESMWLAVG